MLIYTMKFEQSHFMPSLDIATLSFVAVYCSFLYLIMLVLITFVHPKTRGLKVFLAGFACFFVGFFLLGYRGFISDWLTIIVANSLICLGVSCIRFGVSQFLLSKNTYSIFEFWLLAVVITALYYFTFVSPSVGARIINISSYIAIICFICSWQLLP